jgi:hypothetical protein
MLVLSGHGNGAVGEFLKDTDPLSSLNILALSEILKHALRVSEQDKIHILGMDSCNMSMVEVCYALTDKVDYLVASEGFELNKGWPYRQILETLGRNRNESSAEDLAKGIVKEYVDFYSDYVLSGVSVDCSAIDINKFDKLMGAIPKLSEALRKGVKLDDFTRNAVILSHWKAQSYKREEYVDLWDFCDILEKDCEKEKNREGLDTIEAAILGEITTACTEVKQEVDYASQEFSQKTKWGDFLKEYTTITRRELRSSRSNVIKTAGDIDETMLIIRRDPPDSKGSIGQSCRMKNWPKEFYVDPCRD